MKNFFVQWAAKLLLVLLIVSFATWGIADYLIGGKEVWIVSVNKQKVGLQVFERQFEEALRRKKELYDKIGAEVPPQELLRLQQETLNLLIQQEVLRQKLIKMGFVVSTEEVIALVHQMKEFHENGRFSPALLQRVLKASGLTEKKILQSLRDEMQQQTFLQLLVGGMKSVPSPLAQDFYDYQAQERSLKYIAFQHLPLGKLPAHEDLLSYYQDNPEQFQEPESRTFSFFTIPQTLIQQRLVITEESLKALYEQQKDLFFQEETRDIERLVLQTKEQALSMKNKAQQQLSLATLVMTEGVEENAEVLEGITEHDLPRNITQEVFHAIEGQVVGPVKTELGWYLVKILSIIPEGILPFHRARDSLLRDAKYERAQLEIENIVADLQDRDAKGEDFQSLAALFKQEIQVLSLTKEQTLSEAEEELEVESMRQYLLSNGFAQVENTTVIQQLNQDIAVIYLTTVQPSFLPDFKEVQQQVQTLWTETSQQQQAVKKATACRERIEKEGFSLENCALRHNLTVKNRPFKERYLLEEEEDLPYVVVTQLFNAKNPGDLFVVEHPEKKQVILGLYQQKRVPKQPEDNLLTEIQNRLSTSLQRAVVALYLRNLVSEAKIRPNRAALQSLRTTPLLQ